MNNECIFLSHVLVIALSLLLACRMGSSILIGLIGLQGVLSNLFVTKQIMLFGMNATASDVFSIGVIFGLNLLQEFHGRSLVAAAITTNFFLMVFYVVMSQFHLWYLPSVYDTMDQHYVSLLTTMPRLMLASVSVYLIVQVIDGYLYHVLKKLFQDRYLVFRNVVSLVSSQLLDTTLFTFLGLYGIVSSLFTVIIVSVSIKLIAIVCLVPFIALARRML